MMMIIATAQSKVTATSHLLSLKEAATSTIEILRLKDVVHRFGFPSPRTTLSIEYRRRGISIGDVGIFTAFGGFDFMFNICLPPNHPVNRDGLPDGFFLIYPELLESDIHNHTAFAPNSSIVSSDIEKSHGDNDNS